MSLGFDLGEIAVYRIVEQEIPFFDPFEFLPALSREMLEENRSWLEPAGLEPNTGRMILCFQSYVVRTPHHTILIDSCIGNHKDRPHRPLWHQKSDDTYMRGLASAGVSVDDIDFVMCTHMHLDHVGWNTRLENGRWVPTFPNARYLFSERELAHWQQKHAEQPLPYMVDSVLPIIAARRADLVSSEHALDDHVRLEPTPGHTPGHFAVRLGRRAEAAIAGDLIHSPLQARYPDLETRVDHDATEAARTRRAFLERYCGTGTLMCPAHFPSPSVGQVERWQEGFRFIFAR